MQQDKVIFERTSIHWKALTFEAVVKHPVDNNFMPTDCLLHQKLGCFKEVTTIQWVVFHCSK